MLSRSFVTSALVLFGAIFIYLYLSASQQVSVPHVQGKNNTVLFLTTDHYGFCNVHVATAYALLENYPHIQVHYASVPKLAGRLSSVSALARKRTSTVSEITFHPLPGVPLIKVFSNANLTDELVRHPPGLKGIDQLAGIMPRGIAPWPAAEYFQIYEAVSQRIEEVDPAVVILDIFLHPAIDATHDKDRMHAFITPNVISDFTPAGVQPAYTLLWKYPALGSGIPFPIPWNLLLSNIYLNFRIISSVVYVPAITKMRTYLKAKGIKNPIDYMGLYRPDVPWITQTLPGAHLPLDVIPANAILTGPINLAGTDLGPEKTTDLLAWIERTPTVLIAFGSSYQLTQQQAIAMIAAIKYLLQHSDVQVLWKLNLEKGTDYRVVKQDAEQLPDRVRIVSWLDAEPPSLLQSGNIVAFVNHGGAGVFHDALAGGVPQIILPLWADLYDFAQLVEYLELGVWACPDTSPEWTVEGLISAFTTVLIDGVKSAAIKEKAEAMGSQARKIPGRNIAAQEISKLAALGY